MKKLLCLSIVFSLMFFVVPVQAAEFATPSAEAVTLCKGNARAEEVTWYVREYEGKKQKRLWSITEQKWLSGWIDM